MYLLKRALEAPTFFLLNFLLYFLLVAKKTLICLFSIVALSWLVPFNGGAGSFLLWWRDESRVWGCNQSVTHTSVNIFIITDNIYPKWTNTSIGRVMAHQEWLTLSFGLNLEKRLHAVTFNPAVFSADILASMLDTWKKHETQLDVRAVVEAACNAQREGLSGTCSSDCWTWAAAVATWSSRKASSVSVVPLLMLRAHCSRSPKVPSSPYTAPAVRYTFTNGSC